ncbi:MAG: class I SAM-dependent methyltransferase [Balneolaceae bacterium]|nr:class I SAM-dependent methyltransferase [Balneolaceae bacterium]MCH8548307.1 methyltransferase [Balneolaceae bacterium]
MKPNISPSGLQFNRYPPTTNRSLRAWSAADEYLHHYIEENSISGRFIIANDRFGFLSVHLASSKPIIIADRMSQKKAILKNMEMNKLESNLLQWQTPLPVPKNLNTSTAVMLIPKSVDYFRFLLSVASRNLSENGVALCGFMTRHFTPSILEAASEFFEEHEQTLAKKKSRLLILKKPRTDLQSDFKTTITDLPAGSGLEKLIQYPGVFSSNRIDPATQLLLSHLKVHDSEHTLLDLGCGSGIIAAALRQLKPDANIHLMDDFYPAVYSAEKNMEGLDAAIHWDDDLSAPDIPEPDLIVTNPPFHFGHENNIEVTLGLFQQASKKLASGGRLLLVANRHLNYQTHLTKFFDQVNTVAENERFRVTEVKR